MDEKNLPCSRLITDEQGTQKEYSTISQVSKKVKSENEILKLFADTSTRFALQGEAQRIIGKRFPHLKNRNFLKCYDRVRSSLIEFNRNPDTERCYLSGVITCHNTHSCPVCASRIMGYRSFEVGEAVKDWFAEDPDNTCYMITFTFRHTIEDRLSFLLKHSADALVYFWGHRAIRKIFDGAFRVGRITGREVRYNLSSGWHPHEHILVFCKKTDFDVSVFQDIWLRGLKSSGLSGIGDIAFRIEETRSADKYLTKVANEMVLGALKEGRSSGSYAPFQLLSEVYDGSDWAVDPFIEFFSATRGYNALRWSPGLKNRFDITDLSDSDISNLNKDQDSKLHTVFKLCALAYRRLSKHEIAMLINKSSVADYEGIGTILKNAGIKQDEVFA